MILASVRGPPVSTGGMGRGDGSGHGSLPCSVQRSHAQHTGRTGCEVGVQGQSTRILLERHGGAQAWWATGMAGLLGMAGKNSDEAGWAEQTPVHTRPQSRAMCNGCAVPKPRCTNAEKSPPGRQGPTDGCSCPAWPTENRRVAILTCPYRNSHGPLGPVLSCEVTIEPGKESGILARREEARDAPESPGPQGRRSTCLPSSPTRTHTLHTPHSAQHVRKPEDSHRRQQNGEGRRQSLCPLGTAALLDSGPKGGATCVLHQGSPPKTWDGTTAMTTAASQGPMTTLRH